MAESQMRAMLFKELNTPLELVNLPIPEPRKNELLIKVSACGVCRTDLHIIEGDLTEPKLPLILGHEIVGRVVAVGEGGATDMVGKRVGVPWLGNSCGACTFCLAEHENLCETPRFTGYQINGGYAEYTIVDHKYCFILPDKYSDVHAAPLLCAGLIGYRSLEKTNNAKRLGLYGFGAAAHIIVQIANFQGREVFAFTRPGDNQGQKFAERMGAYWAGGSDEMLEEPLDAAIIFAPAGHLVPLALQNVKKGGCVVCAGIHMSDIPSFPYAYLWGERSICSVANLTRQDGERFFKIASECSIQTKVELFALEEANQALAKMKKGQLSGAAVLCLDEKNQKEMEEK